MVWSRKSAIFVAVVASLLVGMASFISYALSTSSSENSLEVQTQNRIAGCEFIKKDRIAAAQGFNEVASSVRERSKDKNLPRSEQIRADISADVYEVVAESFMSRLFECGPQVRTGKEITDKDAIHLAQEQPAND